MKFIGTLAAFTLAACATAPRQQVALDTPVSATWIEGADRFSLSAPAYVAVFEVVPGSGAALMYPSPRNRGLFTAGTNRITYPAYVPGSDVYRGHLRGLGVRVLIASREPLKLDGLFTRDGMRELLGDAVFSSGTSTEVAAAIAKAVVPAQAETDWYVAEFRGR